MSDLAQAYDAVPYENCVYDYTAPQYLNAVARLFGDEYPKGVAVSVDRCVVPRSEWAGTPIRAGSLVEVVSAAAGG